MWAFQPITVPTAAAGGQPTSAGGLHTISAGIGDPGVAVVPQTLHTIEQGISA